MSVRAYKLITAKRAEESTFNLWSDEGQDIIGLACHNGLDEGGGQLEFRKEDVAEELKVTNKIDEPERKEILEAIIKDCGKDDYVIYDCY